MLGSSKMLLKSRIFKVRLNGRRPTSINLGEGVFGLVNGVYGSLYKAFCTVLDVLKVDGSPTTTESPELPDWVKLSGEEHPLGKHSEDDFVLSSIPYWTNNKKIHDKKVAFRSIVNDIVDSDVDKISKILKNKFESLDSVLQALNGCSVYVSESLVEQILKRFRSDWKQAYGFFKWAKLNSQHSSHLYNLMVDILGKSRRFDLMWELVEEMNQLGGYLTLITMSKAIRRLAKAGKHEDAIEAFKILEGFGVNKDTEAMNILLDALAKENSVEHAQKVYSEFKDYIPPNLNTFNILVHGWCKARKIDKAKSTVVEMRKYNLSPNVFTYTALIGAYCLEKDFRKVNAMLDGMWKNGCPPNVVTYTTIMHALGKAKQMNEALEVYEKMKQHGCVPDSSFYSSLIFLLGKAGRVKDALDTFEDMPKQGIIPDVLTYNTMIKMACQFSDEEKALKLLQKMEECHCKPNLDTYMPLLKMCCRMKRMKVLSFLLSHMFKHDVSTDLGIYALLVRGLCKSGQPEQACALFEEAVVRGFVPRDCMYDILIKELEQKEMGKAKQRIEQLMMQVKQQVTSHSNAALSGNWDKSVEPL